MYLSKFIVKNVATPYLNVLVCAITSTLLFGCSTLPTESLSPSVTKTITAPTAIKNNVVTELTSLMPNENAGRHEKTLENGLRVIVKEDHRAPVVMTQVWYKVGGVDEAPGKGGISHLLEHMMFKGTDKVTGSDFDRIVSRFGGSQNAMTNSDYTKYYQYYPAHRLPLALELEADRMAHLKFDEGEFASERQVVMEERREMIDSNPTRAAYEQFLKHAYAQGGQGNSVIGSMQDISNLTLDDLHTWYKKWYAPNNATLVIVGAVTAEQVFSEVDKYFANIPARQLPQRVNLYEPKNKGENTQVTHLDVNLPSFMMAYNVPSWTTSMAAENEESISLDLLSSILSGGFSSRLEKSLVRDKKLLASVDVYYDAISRADSLFLIEGKPQQGVSIEQAQEAILAEIEKLKTQPITEDEMQRIQIATTASLVYQQDSITSQADTIGMMAIAGLDDRIINTYPAKIAKITEAELHAVAKKYLVKKNLTTLQILPKKAD